MSFLAWDPISETLDCVAAGCCVLAGEAAFWACRARGRSVCASAAEAAAVSASAVVVLAVIKFVCLHGISALALLAAHPFGMQLRLLGACTVAWVHVFLAAILWHLVSKGWAWPLIQRIWSSPEEGGASSSLRPPLA